MTDVAQRAAGTRDGREAGSGTARRYLLTVLGEFVLPRRRPVWTATIVGALGALGVEEKATRQALARASSEGLIMAEKVGRRTRRRLTPAGIRLLEEGTARIYGFQRSRAPWDGRWLVLAVTVPEVQREMRHRLRTRLTWAGMGSPAPGLWVVPDASRVDEVAAIVRDLGIHEHALSWVGPAAGVGTPQDVVAAAWSLDGVVGAYRHFIESFRGLVALSDEEAFANQVRLVQAWRRFPFLDPQLPEELLAADWPGHRARSTFDDCHERWRSGAQEFWAALEEDAEHRA